MAGFKIAETHLWGYTINFPTGIIFFPLTYFFDDILTEVYGFKVSRLIIWGGLFCSTLFTLGLWLTVYLPASPIWDANTHHGAKAYELIFTGSLRILIASSVAYFCGEFLNSVILAKLKVLTAGRYFYLRVAGSTVIGVGVDSIIFCNIAFSSIMPQAIIWNIVLTQYLFKLSYEVAMLPITYRLANFLKSLDKIDYYDIKTKFNPFSLRLID